MRILFVTSRPPWPARRGDQARVAGWIAQWQHRQRISVLAQRPPGFASPVFPPGVEGQVVGISYSDLARSLFGALRLPLQVAIHHHAVFIRAVRAEIERFRPHVVVVTLSRMAGVLDAIHGIPVVLDLIDSLPLNMRRRGARQRWLRSFWDWEGERMKRWDCRQLTRGAALALVVSERDRVAVVEASRGRQTPVRVVPFGIELGARPAARVGREPIVLLTGNLGYFPTLDGVRWMASEVWPRVRRAMPQAQWWLAGSRIGRRVRRLEGMEGVRIHTDPGDLSVFRLRATVSVAPLLSGSGTPIKILESMADGLPVVATPQGAEGLDDARGGELAIAHDADEFARHVIRLLGNPRAAEHQASRAWTWIARRHDLGRVAKIFETLLEEVVESRHRVSAGGTAFLSRPGGSVSA